MSKFKVGDKVKIRRAAKTPYPGRTGTVYEITEDDIVYVNIRSIWPTWFTPDELMKVPAKKAVRKR